MINILIPMAGLGSRFRQAGYLKPKPFIDVLGVPMISRVLDNLNVNNCRFILIIQKSFSLDFQVEIEQLKEKHNIEVVEIEIQTEGAACTSLFALDYINTSDPLIIANSDQIIDIDLNAFIMNAKERNLDGSIMVFESNHPKWSYVKIDDQCMMTLLKEKEVISKFATVGIYYFAKGRYFVNSAVKLIVNNDRVNNEFYVAPAYNYLVNSYGKKVGIYEINENQMHGLGTPEDLLEYINHESR